MGLITAGIALGIGGSALEKLKARQAGASAAITQDALSGVGRMASFLPVTGRALGAGIALKSLKGGDLMAKRKKSRKRKVSRKKKRR